MKITIVGAGNAGCLTALHYAFFTKNRSDVEIELIHNPEISPEKVGQATFPDEPKLLWDALDFTFRSEIHTTPKTGILYEGWGRKIDKIFHPFPTGNIGIHFCPCELQNNILKSGLFNVVESDVLDVNNIDSDYIFDCRGKPNDYTDYGELINPINSVILAKPNWDTSNTLWTRSVATPDGWAFIIPSNKNSPSISGAVGYLYNDKCTPKEYAVQNLSNMFDVEITNSFNFKNYYAKKPIIDNRIFLNGNRLSFLEPLEATAVHTYLYWAKECFDLIFNLENDGYYVTSIHRDNFFNEAQSRLQTHLHQIQDFILWHYAFGSKYDSPFWNYAIDLAKRTIDDPYFYDKITKAANSSWYDIKIKEVIDQKPAFGPWRSSSIKYWIDGVC